MFRAGFKLVQSERAPQLNVSEHVHYPTLMFFLGSANPQTSLLFTLFIYVYFIFIHTVDLFGFSKTGRNTIHFHTPRSSGWCTHCSSFLHLSTTLVEYITMTLQKSSSFHGHMAFEKVRVAYYKNLKGKIEVNYRIIILTRQSLWSQGCQT